MAFLSCDFYSESLKLSTSMSVILPQKTFTQIGLSNESGNSDFPVLYLLHGMSDDHTIWMRRTSIERYVASLGLAVVMPSAQRSFYADMQYGGKYWTFISEELPEIVKSFFRLSSSPDKTFVAGLSMGGYGAFKLAMTFPERFAAAASLSGVMDVYSFANSEAMREEFKGIYGDIESIHGSGNDLFHLASALAEKKCRKPKLFQCCGTEDFLYEDNLKYKAYLEKLGIELHYEEFPGVHEWGFWDKTIQQVLRWLPLGNLPRI